MTAFRRVALYTLVGAVAALSVFLLTERPVAPTYPPAHPPTTHS